MKAMLSFRLTMLIILVSAALFWLLRPLPVLADALPCIGLADMLAALDQKYGESVIWTGITGPALTVVTANPDGSTWTAFVQRPDNMACPFAQGSQWLPGSAPPPPILGREG